MRRHLREFSTVLLDAPRIAALRQFLGRLHFVGALATTHCNCCAICAHDSNKCCDRQDHPGPLSVVHALLSFLERVGGELAASGDSSCRIPSLCRCSRIARSGGVRKPRVPRWPSTSAPATCSVRTIGSIGGLRAAAPACRSAEGPFSAASVNTVQPHAAQSVLRSLRWMRFAAAT